MYSSTGDYNVQISFLIALAARRTDERYGTVVVKDMNTVNLAW